MQRQVVIALALGALVVVAGLGWSLGARGGEVEIRQAYFVAAQPAGDHVNLTANLFVTNAGLRASERVGVVVFVVPQNGLSTFTTRVEVGGVGARTTHQAPIPIVIPDFNASRHYRVDFLVFEGDLLTQRGSGNVGWGGGHWIDSSKAVADALTVSEPSFSRVG